MKKIVVISVIGISALSILSGCGHTETNDKTKQKNKTEQLLPSGTNKEHRTSESPKVDKNATEKANETLLTQFFTSYGQFDSKKVPAYQRAENLLKISNEKVVDYLMPNVLASGKNAQESVAYTQVFTSPIKITESASSNYQYDVTIAYAVKVGQNENKYKETYSVTIEEGKVSVVKKIMTAIYNAATNTYE